MRKAVQQMMLGKVLRSEEQAARVLETIRQCGYDGIELNGYMIRRTSLFVRMLTSAAGMPSGRGGAFDWAALTQRAGLKVVGLHEDLGTLKRDTDAVIRKAKELRTDTVTITGMYAFDYASEQDVRGLCADLNRCGQALAAEGLALLYHNHNIELCRTRESGERAYDLLIRETDPAAVNFEFDSYWFTDGGADAGAWMEKLGGRLAMWHISDRGLKQKGKPITPIVKADATELGYGNMNLDRLTKIAKASACKAVVLETHRNHIHGDPMQSIQRSAAYLNRQFPSVR